MGVPGLRLCSDIVADGLEQLHPATKAPSTHTPSPWVILRGRRGCAWVGVWIGLEEVVCALRGVCMRESVCVICCRCYSM